MASGRTDAGVHALAQVAHLELYTDLPPEIAAPQINDELPADIHIRAIQSVPHRFHARHDAVSRMLPLPDLHGVEPRSASPSSGGSASRSTSTRMRAAAAALRWHEELRGVHRRRSRREVDATSSVDSVDDRRGGRAGAGPRSRASHFLWKMVRRMVGVLAAVGRGDLDAVGRSGA